MTPKIMNVKEIQIGDHIFFDGDPVAKRVFDREHDPELEIVVLYFESPNDGQNHARIFNECEEVKVFRQEERNHFAPTTDFVKEQLGWVEETGTAEHLPEFTVEPRTKHEYPIRIAYDPAGFNENQNRRYTAHPARNAYDDLSRVEEQYPDTHTGSGLHRSKKREGLTDRQIGRMLHVAFIQNKQTKRIFDDWLTVKCAKPDAKGVSRSYISVHWREAKCDMTIAGRARDVIPQLCKLLNKGKK
ncbi:hypothetical protein CPT_Maja_078 [Burkholderia phage Maja]|uniref:Uncharacterized protein n=1 Tax=Burkholderia phage Maja TaxID=2767571 RepID=A0A7S6R8A0_9CAUD|nr:hypothetical protein CPT_Maja_078 [Burkholderia phage Maja]